jgi:hypothetical protein
MTSPGSAVRAARVANPGEHAFHGRRKDVKTDVHDGERISAHGGHVAHVHHDRGPAGKVGIMIQEVGQHALGGEEQISGPVGDGGGVVADEDAGLLFAPALHRQGRLVYARRDARDVALRAERRASGEAYGHRLQLVAGHA